MLRPPAAETQAANPIVIIADKIERKPHLAAFLQTLHQQNLTLSGEEAIKYAGCKSSAQIALALRKYCYSVKLIMIGPGLQGNAWTLARMLCKRVRVLLVLEPAALANPLYAKIRTSLEALGIVTTISQNATEPFFKPVIREHVLPGIGADNELAGMSPEERAETNEKRLQAAKQFPSLTETQQNMAKLDDMDNPKKWAEAINPDVLTRTVILRTLNSPYCGFHSRVATIEQAVQLASARTGREIVLACQIRHSSRKLTKSPSAPSGAIPWRWVSSLSCSPCPPIRPSRAPRSGWSSTATASTRIKQSCSRRYGCGKCWPSSPRKTLSPVACSTTSASSP